MGSATIRFIIQMKIRELHRQRTRLRDAYQIPSPVLREWAATPLSPGMRQTFFGPLIEDVDQRIIRQQSDRWNRTLFEQHLMGYTMCTDRYRLVVWRDVRDRDAEPVFVELYNHQTDHQKTCNVASDHPDVVEALKA